MATHIVTQLSRYQSREGYAFTRPGDDAGQSFALESGAVWAGACTKCAHVPLEATNIIAPVGSLVPAALRALAKDERVVCAGIHMSDIRCATTSLLGGAIYSR